MTSSHILQSRSSIILPMELDKNPINHQKVLRMKPKMKINHENRTFQITMEIPGFKNEDITVFAGNGKISVKAVDKTRFKNVLVCKVHKADYSLPPGVLMDKLRKSYKNDVLCIRGEIEKNTSCKQ